MKINMRESPGNGNLDGEISFLLISGEQKQIFRSGWRVIRFRGMDRNVMKLECIHALIQIRLKELMSILNKQVQEGIIVVPSGSRVKIFPLEASWSIE